MRFSSRNAAAPRFFPHAERYVEALASSRPVGLHSFSTVQMDRALLAWIYGSCCEDSGNVRAGDFAGREGWIQGPQEMRPWKEEGGWGRILL